MRRNKRCLLAYHRVRAEKLEEMCWNDYDVLEQPQESGHNADKSRTHSGSESSLSPEEEEYFRQYSEMLAAFKGRWTDIDMTGSLDPPKDLFIDVRVLKDAGEIQTEYGYVKFLNDLSSYRFGHSARFSMADGFALRSAINLTKNSQFYVRHGDVERLIAQGFLQRLS